MARRIFLALLALMLAGIGTALAAPAPPAPPLRLHEAALPAAQRRLLQRLGPPAPQLIVQFPGPIAPAERAALAATGVSILEYLPDYAFLVDGPPEALAAAAALPGLARSLPLPASARLAPALLRAVAAGDGAGPLRLTAWPGRQAELAAQLAAAGLDPAQPLGAADLRALAGLPALRWAEPAGRPRLLNGVARTIMGVEAGAWAGAGLYGDGQILAIADSGLDTGDLDTISPDFAGRIVASQVLSPTGDLEDENGHGTHVAGSAAGAGVQSGADPAAREFAGSHAGVAPRASLLIQAFEANAAGDVFGLPGDYYELFDLAYAAGARLHSDSWGDITGPPSDAEAMFGGYPFGSQRADAFVWDHPDMAIFVAAGNSGADGVPGPLGFCTGSDGVVDPDSLLSPATAKNVITVGASENLRDTGGLATSPWLLLSFCFLEEPIVMDLTSNNASGMAAFSSRGPTDDGRVKPDLVAPGTNILSNRSHAPDSGILWGVHDANYVYSGGTSMATPLAAGAGTLVRQWLVASGQASPSAALVKAVLLNTARDISPGQYGTGATREIPAAWPNSVAGWGRADLAFLAAGPPFAIWYDDHAAVDTGATVEYAHGAARPLRVTSSAQPLRVQLVWTDPPASLAAAQQLVNDLDLELVAPDGTIYRGNGGPAADRVNNVEGVILAQPPVGDYTVRVRAHNVPVASQPYALVVSGPLAAAGSPSITAHPQDVSVDVGEPFSLSVTAQGSAPLSYQWLHEGEPIAGATGSSYSVGAAGAGHAGMYTVRVSNGAGSATSLPAIVSVSRQSQSISFTPPAGVRYGDGPISLGATASSGLPVSYSLIGGPGALSGGSLSISGAGVIQLRVSQAGDDTYAPAQADFSIGVAKASLTVTADDQSMTQGSAPPALTLRYAGFVGADGPADLDTLPTASTSATAASPPGDYPISVSGGGDADYSLTYVAGTMRVLPPGEAPVTLYLPLLMR